MISKTLKESSKFMAGGAFSMLLLFISMYTYGDLNISRNAIFSTAMYFVVLSIALFVGYRLFWGDIEK